MRAERSGLDRQLVIELLAELERRLANRGVALDIQIVGGAALLLHGLIDRATDDIDARYRSSAIVDAVASEMVDDYGLPEKWLNSRAMAFLPENVRWMAIPGSSLVGVQLADLPTLAAMKVAAERDKDIIDLGHIVNALEIDAPKDLVDLAYEKYGVDSIPLSQNRSNYEIVAEEAIAASNQLKNHRLPGTDR